MRKLRKQPVRIFNPWDMSLEAGERVYKPQPELEAVHMYDLIESTGWRKRTSGELTPVLVKKHGVPRLAVINDTTGIWYWKD